MVKRRSKRNAPTKGSKGPGNPSSTLGGAGATARTREAVKEAAKAPFADEAIITELREILEQPDVRSRWLGLRERGRGFSAKEVWNAGVARRLYPKTPGPAAPALEWAQGMLATTEALSRTPAGDGLILKLRTLLRGEATSVEKELDAVELDLTLQTSSATEARPAEAGTNPADTWWSGVSWGTGLKPKERSVIRYMIGLRSDREVPRGTILAAADDVAENEGGRKVLDGLTAKGLLEQCSKRSGMRLLRVPRDIPLSAVEAAHPTWKELVRPSPDSAG